MIPPMSISSEPDPQPDAEAGKSVEAGPLLRDLLRIQREKEIFESATGAAVHLEEMMRAVEEEEGDTSVMPTMAQMEDVHLALLATISEQALRVYRLGHDMRVAE